MVQDNQDIEGQPIPNESDFFNQDQSIKSGSYTQLSIT